MALEIHTHATSSGLPSSAGYSRLTNLPSVFSGEQNANPIYAGGRVSRFPGLVIRAVDKCVTDTFEGPPDDQYFRTSAHRPAQCIARRQLKGSGFPGDPEVD
jgi:hypothetical protein